MIENHDIFSPDQVLPKPARVSRRGLFGWSTLAALALVAKCQTDEQKIKQDADREKAALASDSKSFVDEFLPPNFRIGGNFSSGQADYIGLDSLECLKFITEDLGMPSIRMGLSGSRIWNRGQIDLSRYRELLNFFFRGKHHTKLGLNIGPIKVLRWPEEHIPQHVIDSLHPCPLKGSTILTNSDLGKWGLDYLDRLLYILTTEYGSLTLKSGVNTIQADNEPFNPFGKYRWTVSQDFIEQTVEITNSYLPQAQILFNSAAFTNVPQISQLLDSLHRKHPDWDNHFVFGYDHYDQIPGFSDLPVIGNLDLFSYASLLHQPLYPTNIPGLKRKVSEIQMERWGKPKRSDDPENSSLHLHKILLRSQDMFFQDYPDPEADPWGVEILAKALLDKTATPEQEKMAETIRYTNLRQPSLAAYGKVA